MDEIRITKGIEDIHQMEEWFIVPLQIKRALVGSTGS